MTDQHPITPPPKQVARWVNEIYYKNGVGFDVPLHSITMRLVERAAQWGANQELEACVEWITKVSWLANDLRAARRPKPPSLKEQTLELVRPAGTDGAYVTFGPEELDLIRRALEALPND
jgi:hypothetical protein